MKPTNIDNISCLCELIIETIKKKNHDYGDSFAQIYSEEGDLVGGIHIKEKANRIMQLIKSSAEVNESLDDALLDCAGYCLLVLDQRQQYGKN